VTRKHCAPPLLFNFSYIGLGSFEQADTSRRTKEKAMDGLTR